MSGGFFRGTSADQDTRFSNKQAKLLKTQKFAPELEYLVDITKVKMDVVRPWIAKRVTEFLGFEDEVLINFIYGLLEGKEVNGKEVQIQLTGFMEKNTSKFMKELWALLVSAQKNASGVPQQFLDAKEEETRKKKEETDRIVDEIQKRKEKEREETENEKPRKMDGGLNNNSAEESNRGRERGSHAYGDENGASVKNGFRGRARSSQSPSSDHSPSPQRGAARRSISKSNSRSYSKERSISKSTSRSPRARRRSISPRRRSISPGRQAARESISPRHRSHSGRRSLSRTRYRSPSPMRRRVRSPARRRSPSPLRRGSPSPARRRSPSPLRRRLRSPARRRSPSPLRRWSRSPLRRRSPSPRRRRSPSPLGRRSLSPRRRRSPSPARRHRRRSTSSASSRSRSPPLRRPATPVRRRYQSPVRRRSPYPDRRRPPSPDRRKFPSPDGRKSRSPVRRRSPIPSRRRPPTRSPTRSPSPVSRNSASPVRHSSASPPKMKSPRLQKSPSESPRGRIRNDNPAMMVRRQLVSLSPQRDHSDRNRSHRRVPSVSPSPEKSPSFLDAPRNRTRTSGEDRRLATIHESPGKRAGGRMTLDGIRSSPTKPRDQRVRRGSPGTSEEKLRNARENEANKLKPTERGSVRSSGGKKMLSPDRPASRRHDDSIDSRQMDNEMRSEEIPVKEVRDLKKSPRKGSVPDERLDISFPEEGSKLDEKRSSHSKLAVVNSNKKAEQRSPSVDSDSGSEGTDKQKAGVADKKKHGRSNRREVASDDTSSESEIEDRKEAKRRRKEEKKSRKEERRRRREERRRRREEKRASKRKRKSKDADIMSSDVEKNDKYAKASNGERGSKKYSSEDEATESQKKRLEIELREKALESLRAKKGISR